MSTSHDDEQDDAIEKVLIIGLDGATFSILEPMIKNGRLPNLSNLIEEGVSGILESTLPPVTIPAWASMVTGKNPGKLGLFDLLKRVGYSVEPNNHCYRNHNPIWHVLNRYGIKTGVMNVPGTYPPEEVDGFMVTGMLTPSKRSPYSYPTTLSEDLENNVSEYEIDVPQWQYFDENEFLKDIYKATEKRRKAVEYLLKNNPCHFYMVVFTSSDRIQHLLWDKKEVLEEYWDKLDETIGNILDHFGDDTTIFVVSDHGFGPLEKTFFVNEWLREKRLLRIKPKINEKTLVKLGRVVEKLYRFLGERKLIRPIAGFLNNIVGLDLLQKYTFEYLSNERLESRVNWRKTKAFSCVHTPHFGNIYLNMKGKMLKGCVTIEERDDLTNHILKELQNLFDVKKEKIIEVKVYKAEEVYSGPHLDEAPDIVFLLEGGNIELDAKVGDGKLFVEGAPLTGWKGTHNQEGLFIAKGPNIKRGIKIEKAAIIDIAPTILQIYGINNEMDMDGKVLSEIFKENTEFPEREEITDYIKKDFIEKTLSDEETVLIEAKLRKLGYIS